MENSLSLTLWQTKILEIASRSNCLSGELFHIILSIPQHGVEDCEELSGAGGEDEFDGFSGVLQAFAESLDGGIAARGDEGGNVEGAAHIGAAAPDAPFAA